MASHYSVIVVFEQLNFVSVVFFPKTSSENVRKMSHFHCFLCNSRRVGSHAIVFNGNKPGTAQIGAISKAQK